MSFKDFFTGESLGQVKEDAVATTTIANAVVPDLPITNKKKKVATPGKVSEVYSVKKFDIILSEHDTLNEALKNWSALANKRDVKICFNGVPVESDQWTNLTEGLNNLISGTKFFDMLEERFQSGIEKMT